MNSTTGGISESNVMISELERLVPAIVGAGTLVSTISGKTVRYVNLDNAATTSPFIEVMNKVNSFLEWYASVHRGSGYKSLLSTKVLEDARSVIADFVGADANHDIVVFGINTTHCINKLARRLALKGTDLVLLSEIEHSSNDLPWRKVATVERIPSENSGELSLNNLKKYLREKSGQVKLVAITGASNITGYLPPIHEVARIAHDFGVRVFIDCSQLAPHRQIDLLAHNDPSHLDFIAFSGHKMYAPFGLGVLIGNRNIFEAGAPDDAGGGTVDMITENDFFWTSLPAKEHAGTPNAVGAVALAAAIKLLLQIGFDNIAQNERKLTSCLLRRIKKIPKVTLYGDTDENITRDRLGVIPFNVEGMPHGLVAAVLGFEYGIGVRHGHLCQYEFVRRTLGITSEDQLKVLRDIKKGSKVSMYGVVRASLAIYNNEEDIDRFLEALEKIVLDGPQSTYVQDSCSGEFSPVGWTPEWRFSL